MVCRRIAARMTRPRHCREMEMAMSQREKEVTQLRRKREGERGRECLPAGRTSQIKLCCVSALEWGGEREWERGRKTRAAVFGGGAERRCEGLQQPQDVTVIRQKGTGGFNANFRTTSGAVQNMATLMYFVDLQPDIYNYLWFSPSISDSLLYTAEEQ